MTTASEGTHYTLGGRDYPMRVEGRCRTCVHPRRVDIDTWFLEGAPPSVIAERLGEGSPTDSSLSRHRDRHLPTDLVAQEALLREGAGSEVVDLDEAVEALGDSREMARILAARGLKAIRDGQVVPVTFSDVVRATDLLMRSEQLAGHTNDRDADVNRLALIRMLRAVQDTVTRDVWEAIGRRAQDDPVLRALDDHLTRQATPRSTELVDEALATGDRLVIEVPPRASPSSKGAPAAVGPGAAQRPGEAHTRS